ncbi:MAG: hypothetical protein EBR28_02835 [Planctomycetia bacterium]|nr:hypothetical protein [Planctomycetia bacterium]
MPHIAPRTRREPRPPVWRGPCRALLLIVAAIIVARAAVADEVEQLNEVEQVDVEASAFESDAETVPDVPLLAEPQEILAAASACCDDRRSCTHQRRHWLTWRDRVTAGAEYLLLRPTFSNATALYETKTSTTRQLAQTALNYDFGYSSGVRGFIGYRLDDGWMVRFSYLNIFASSAVSGIASGNWAGGTGTGYLGPYNTSAVVAGQSISSNAGVNLNVYDLELAGRLNPTACGPAEGGSPWDSAAAVGLRFADSSVITNVFNDRGALGQVDNYFVRTSRTFQGVGPRLALQGRRYLGSQARWSVFASGAASLLVGSVSNVDTRLRVGDFPSNLQSQREGGPLVVPNLDLSLGATWQIAERTSFSAGWLLMYWGQLGYSERIATITSTNLPDLVPLTNSSLTYDGAFFRLTHNF